MVENDQGQPWAVDHTWTITGQVQGDTPAEVAANYLAMERAYSVWGRDLALVDATGTTFHAMPSGGSYTGVKIVRPPSYPKGEGAQLSTFRDYTIVATCRYPYGPLQLYKSFTETLSVSGGGPERDVVECVNAPPQEQVLKLYTAYRATQRGAAVGLFGAPPIPGPIFPGKERRSPEIATSSPRMLNGRYVDFAASWAYEFVSGTPLVGVPTYQPIG